MGGSDNLPLVLRPLFIEVCGIFSGRLELDNACTIYKLYNIKILYNSDDVSLCISVSPSPCSSICYRGITISVIGVSEVSEYTHNRYWDEG